MYNISPFWHIFNRELIYRSVTGSNLPHQAFEGNEVLQVPLTV
ncbi:hypothetical protein [Paraliobacillus salinarum]|nr:hypothetical protein [Paraliobacillus salinarum]